MQRNQTLHSQTYSTCISTAVNHSVRAIIEFFKSLSPYDHIKSIALTTALKTSNIQSQISREGACNFLYLTSLILILCFKKTLWYVPSNRMISLAFLWQPVLEKENGNFFAKVLNPQVGEHTHTHTHTHIYIYIYIYIYICTSNLMYNLGTMINLIWWRSFTSGDLSRVEYLFNAITTKYTLTGSGSMC